MAEHNKLRSSVLGITRTGLFIALLITLQWATAGTLAFAGQYITGSCVNCVLAIAALIGGLYSGIVVAALSPFCAFLLGIGPAMLPIVPCIALGNLAFVILLNRLMGRKWKAVWKQTLIVAVSAIAKFLVLYVAVVKVFIPLWGGNLPAKQVAIFTTMFSWPQLVTALIGGGVAAMILPLLRKAIQ